MFTAHILRERGHLAEDFKDVYLDVPWPDFIFYPGQTVDERIQNVQNKSRTPFNIYKTHYSPPTLPLRDDVKYVVVVRNPFDAAASLRPFFYNHGKTFAKMWGGFPPGSEEFLIPDDEWEKMCIKDSGNGHPLLNEVVLEFLPNWWPYRNKPNVLFLHYSDRLKDDFAQLQRLNSFLNLQLSDQELNEIQRKVSFKEMKSHADEFSLRYYIRPWQEKGKIPKDVEFFMSKDDVMLNKGPARSGDQELPASFKKGLTDLLHKVVPDQKAADWFQNGGPVPK